jgi:lipopolysaccharide transport system permease protein
VTPPVNPRVLRDVQPVTVIRPRTSWIRLDLREVWEFREILWVLATRDIRVRYKQTLLGGAWAILQPFTAMVVFSIFFGHLAGIGSRTDVPYPLFAFSGLVPWWYFSQSLTSSAASLVDHRAVITKVYFPRILLPAAPLLSGLVDLGLAVAVLAGMMLWYGVTPGVAVLLLPVFVGLAMATALAAGLWLAALNALYRDFRYVIPYLLQIWLFASPVAYPSALVPAAWRPAYGVNPMAGVIEGFRWALLDTAPPGPLIWVSAAIVIFGLATGLAFFQRMERTVVDVV